MYPAYLQVTDIAGLIKGASQGEGLGNAFLSHIQAVDGMFHIVRYGSPPAEKVVVAPLLTFAIERSITTRFCTSMTPSIPSGT
jgi:GTPase involved in cell partitioning and DNA repair